MPAKIKKVDSNKVMSSVASVVNFMKEQVASDLFAATQKENIDLSSEDLRKLCHYVEVSLTNSFTKASSQIEASLK